MVGFNPDGSSFFLVFLHAFGEDAEFGEGFEVGDDGFVGVVKLFDKIFLVDVLGDALLKREP
jgi:hypothetical protein